MRHLRHRRHEVLLLHVIAPEEEDFPFKRPARFRNLEDRGHTLRVDPRPSARRMSKVPWLLLGVEESIRGMDADYHRASTAEARRRR